MKIAFIDHSFHKQTRSSNFFKEIIATNNDIVDFWDESWSKGKTLDIDEINKGNFDTIIYWQVISKPIQIKKLKCKNIVWVPMYDTEIVRPLLSLQLVGYLKFNIKIISFSESLTKKINKLGFNIITVKYYPKPNFSENGNNQINVLFWQRIKKINWDLIKKILDIKTIDNIYFKNNPDPQYKELKPPTLTDIDKYNIKIINEWLDDNQYLELLKKCDIYIAPREYEGIGMGFLDAMAIGLVVISPNKPTANEYIEDGVNGFLYNIKKPKIISLSDINTIRKNSKKNVIYGFELWQNQKKEILKYIKPTMITTSMKNKSIYYIYILYNPVIEILKKIKNFLRIKFY